MNDTGKDRDNWGPGRSVKMDLEGGCGPLKAGAQQVLRRQKRGRVERDRQMGRRPAEGRGGCYDGDS